MLGSPRSHRQPISKGLIINCTSAGISREVVVLTCFVLLKREPEPNNAADARLKGSVTLRKL